MNNDRRTSFWGPLRTTFGRGLAVIVPVVITIWVLNSLFNAIDGIISPIFDQFLHKHIPGLGFISMIVLIFLVGILSRNLIGRAMGSAFERVITSIPLARTIYSTMKDLMQIGGKGKSFRQVVLIEYPRHGVMTIGFVTNEITIENRTGSDEMISVYIPNPPNPTSGMLVLVPRKEIQVLDMSVEEGLKLVLSG
ncbi:MAG: DUF502 domain-containing protein [Ignavibacteriae bacterium]|nr:DUF502 domain-containing protein [Ignavibacteriota bacterium]